MKTFLTALTVTGLTFGLAGNASAQAPCAYTKLVDSWYHRYLGRHVDPIGIHDHVGALRRGNPVDFVEASILGSNEYYHRNGCTPEGYILALYRDVAGVSPAPGDLNHWVRRLYGSRSPHLLALRFLQENRFEAVAPPPVFVDPDPGFFPPGPVVFPSSPGFGPRPVLVPRTILVPRPIAVPEPIYFPSYPRPGVSIHLRFGR